MSGTSGCCTSIICMPSEVNTDVANDIRSALRLCSPCFYRQKMGPRRLPI